MRAVLDAYDAVQDGMPVTQQLLQPIFVAASDSRKLIFDLPVSYLDEFTGKYEEARAAVAKMAVDKRSHTRFNAIMCIGEEAPHGFKVKLLRQGLRDKSAKVRQKSADWIFRRSLRDLVADLEEALAAENDAKAKGMIEYALKSLRGGYTVKHEPDGTVAVTVFTLNGGLTQWFEQAELDRRGIEAIVAQFPSGT
jgi:hypothetical protein